MRTLTLSTLLLAMVALTPEPAAAYWTRLCSNTWQACASVQNVQFSGNQLRLQVTNISTEPGTENGYIRNFLMKFKDPVSVTGVSVSGVSGTWSAGTQTGNAADRDWDIFARGDGGSTGIYVGQTATFVITFGGDVSANELVDWAANFQALGPDNIESEYAVVPEPITIVLFAIGGICLRSRKKNC